MAREMKNSGVKWIGEIPADWSVSKIKNNFGIISGCGFSERFQGELTGDFPFCKASDINGIEKTVSTAANYVSKEVALSERYNIIPIHSILFAKIGEALKKNHRKINTVECIVDNNCQALYRKVGNDINFMYYLFKHIDMTWFDNAGTIPCVNNLALKNFLIPLPSLSEQKSIADFLDAKCGEIDGLLADLDAEVNTLTEYKKSIIAEVTTQGLNPNVAMKSSGVDWIGNIPAHWHIVPFRSYVVERAEKNLGGRNQNLLALSFALGVTRYADKKYNMDRVKDDFSGYQIVHKNDLVLSPNDIIKGSIFVSEHDGCISPMYKVFSNYDTSTYNLYYLSYHLRTKESGRKFFYIARGLIGEMLDNGKYVTRRMTVSRQDLLKFKVLLPPIEEQNEIVQYLDSKCAAIDQAITDKTQQIETLKAYKSSLIYEYVTGKKQVL